MTEPNDKSDREQTIVAVDVGISGRVKDLPRPVKRGPRLHSWGLVGGFTALSIVFVFIFLPQWVERRRIEAPVSSLEPASEDPVQFAITEQELQAFAQDAEQLLADLLTQQIRLQAVSAESWGADEWLAYDAAYRDGDRAYLRDDFRAAVPLYRSALEHGESLLERSAGIVAAALDSARGALAAGDAELAIDQFDLVLSIEPGNAVAAQGRARAEKLPEVLAHVARGDRLAVDEQLDEAAGAYRAALAIDPEWPPASRGLSRTMRLLNEARFEASMSQAYAALTAEDYDRARQRFQAALAMRPDSVEAADGQLQAEQGIKLGDIKLAEARAIAFERRELWDRAIGQYQAALETDATLAFAVEGLQRSQARQDLDTKLENLIGNPSLLLADEILADANALLSQAGAIADRGPRLDAQVDRLGELIESASTPLAVRLQSDELTEVTVYRVGRLGRFAALDIMVRPGTYTMIGSRNGYRDVRKTFTVVPGRELAPIEIVCVEPI